MSGTLFGTDDGLWLIAVGQEDISMPLTIRVGHKGVPRTLRQITKMSPGPTSNGDHPAVKAYQEHLMRETHRQLLRRSLYSKEED